MNHLIQLLQQRPLQPAVIAKHIKQLREGVVGVNEMSIVALQHGVVISFDNHRDDFVIAQYN